MRLMYAFLAALSLSAVSVGSASAETLEWRFTSEYPYVVELEFYSQDRNHIWPGGGEVYVLDDYEQKTVTLSCRPGEYICYGAWDAGGANYYWGVGRDQSHGCDNCCARCNGGYVVKTLGR